MLACFEQMLCSMFLVAHQATTAHLHTMHPYASVGTRTHTLHFYVWAGVHPHTFHLYVWLVPHRVDVRVSACCIESQMTGGDRGRWSWLDAVCETEHRQLQHTTFVHLLFLSMDWTGVLALYLHRLPPGPSVPVAALILPPTSSRCLITTCLQPRLAFVLAHTLDTDLDVPATVLGPALAQISVYTVTACMHSATAAGPNTCIQPVQSLLAATHPAKAMT